MAIVQDMGHVILQVGDMEEALRLYRDVLGFGVQGRVHPVWTVITSKGGSLTLYKKAKPVPCVYGKDDSPFNLHVRDFEEAARIIEDNGYVVRRHDAHNGFLRDPWGNVLWLHDHHEDGP